MNISDLSINDHALVKHVGSSNASRQHFLDMGLIPGTEIVVVKYAPMGDPIEILVHGYALTLRKADAESIEVEKVDEKEIEQPQEPPIDHTAYNASLHEHNAHPGLGEDGKYHDSKHEHPLPKGTVLTFALVGQQNSGKTTLFNKLTGANQHVGNFPGVTVDCKSGTIKGHADTLVTDLPGIYSLSPYSSDELLSRSFILDQKPHAIINVVDAGNIERNLYLTMQLMELGIPMVLALNMMDEVKSNGGSIRVNEMEKILGIPVVPISAINGAGIEELIDHALHVAKYQEPPMLQDFCGRDDNGGAVHRCLHSLRHLVEDHAQKASLPIRFVADKIAEGDEKVLQALNLTQNESEMVEHIVLQMEEERGLDRASAIADMRYTFIRRLSKQAVVKPSKSKGYLRSQKIDRVLTGRWTAIPIFIVLMMLVIYLSIEVLGAPLQDWLDQGITALAEWCDNGMANANVSPAIRSLVVDGIFGGVGSVLSFVPIIIILFFFLSLLEDSGYMARVAFVTDSVMRKLGLSGRSIVPLLIGFGCSVPAIMATRTLPSLRDRKLTVMLTPFMSCSAKIPVYGFFSAAFFPDHAGLVMICLYLIGIIVGILVALISKWLGRSGEAAPFVMELPNYRVPTLLNMAHLMWDKTRDFVVRAFTIIFVATIVVWLFQTFDFRFNMVENGENSMLAVISSWIAPIFAPIGLGNWQTVTALVSGFIAKESVVSTLEVLNATQIYNTVTVVPMLVFSLIYTPCVAAIAAVRRELGRMNAVYMVVLQCVVAWIVAFVAYRIALCF